MRCKLSVIDILRSACRAHVLILFQALQLSNRSLPPSHSPSSAHARLMPIAALPLPAQLHESDLLLFRKLDSGVAFGSHLRATAQGAAALPIVAGAFADVFRTTLSKTVAVKRFRRGLFSRSNA